MNSENGETTVLAKFHGGNAKEQWGALEVTDVNSPDDGGGAVVTYGVAASQSATTDGMSPDFWAPGSPSEGMVVRGAADRAPHFLCDPTKHNCVSVRLPSIEIPSAQCVGDSCQWTCKALSACVANVVSYFKEYDMSHGGFEHKRVEVAKGMIDSCRAQWGQLSRIAGQTCPASAGNVGDIEWNETKGELKLAAEIAAAVIVVAAFDGATAAEEVDVFADAMANMSDEDMLTRIGNDPAGYYRAISAPGGKWFWVRPL